tara:strand:+ start:444 stop:1004 length:561 start_codon:yes stop_codon:yes gene_type:complete
MSTLFVNNLNTASGTTIQVPAGKVLHQAGSIIQVVQTAKTDTFTAGNNTAFADITGMSVSITPKFSNSKIMIWTSLTGEVQNNTYCAHFRLMRGSTAIGIGDANSSAPRGSFHLDSYASGGSLAMITASFHFMDSPATTSATTYKVQVQVPNGSGNTYIGRNHSDNNGTAGPGRYPSIITAMEIAQ